MLNSIRKPPNAKERMSYCGKIDGITASDTHATAGSTVAIRGMSFGTRIYIDSFGEFIIEDCSVGSGVDIFGNAHAECYTIAGHYVLYIVG